MTIVNLLPDLDILDIYQAKKIFTAKIFNLILI